MEATHSTATPVFNYFERKLSGLFWKCQCLFLEELYLILAHSQAAPGLPSLQVGAAVVPHHHREAEADHSHSQNGVERRTEPAEFPSQQPWSLTVKKI